jgi:hypothetical protein
MRWSTVVLVVGLVGVGVVSGIPDRPTKKDTVQSALARLQGTWAVMSIKEGQVVKFLFQGDKLTIKVREQVRWTGVLKIDPTKNPKRLDIIRSIGGSEVESRVGPHCWKRPPSSPANSTPDS